MGSEKNTTPNMNLSNPVVGVTTDPYWSSYVVDALNKIDSHDHTSGSGAVLTQGSIQVSGDFSFRDYGSTDMSFVKYTNPTTYGTAPGDASTYFMNGDYYIKDGSGNAIQLTIGGGLNASLVGGFTGDYASSGAYCVFVEADNEYRFFISDHVMSRAVVGSLEVRSRTLNKDLYGMRIETTGNITSTYTWTVPDTQAPANSFLWLNSSGVVAYVAKAPYDALVTLLSDSVPNAFAPIMRSSAGVVVATAQTDAIMLPKGTEAQRPTGATGLLRFNTDSSSFEAFVDGDWGSVSGSTSISDWTQNTNYRLGNIVTYLGVQWRVTVKHTSSTTFDLSKVASFENGVKLFNLAGHGLSVLNVVRYNGTAWVKAQADAEEHLSDPPAIIWMVQGDYFVVVDVSRDLYIASHGLTDDTYFLSESTAGGLATVSPVFSNPIIGVLDSNNVHLLNYRPTVVGTEVSFGNISTAEDVDTTGRANGDSLVWNSTTSKYESSAAGIQDAPVDGNQYARMNSTWQQISTDTLTLPLVANSNGITAGNVVELVSTGGQNVQNIYHCEAPTIGSLLTLAGTNNVAYLSAASAGTNTALVAFAGTVGEPYRSYVGVVGETNIGSFLNFQLFTGSPVTATSLSKLTDATHALAYGVYNSSAMYITIVSNSGTNTPTKSGAVVINSVDGRVLATCALTTSNLFAAYADTSGDSQIRTAISNGTNEPTLGTALNVNGTNNANFLSLARTSDTTAMLVLQNSSDSNGEIAHIAGGTTNAPTASTLAHLDGTNNCTYITQSPIDSDHTLCAYNNVTTSNGCLAVIQANGTNAPTVVSRAVFESYSNVYGVSITANDSNTHTLAYSTVNISGGYARTVHVGSNYNLTLSTENKYYTANNASNTSVAALGPTTSISAFTGNGSDGFAGTLTLTPTPIISGQLVGIAQTSATNGATASVAVGPLVSGTFTSGADYYVSGAGGIGLTASPIRVGKAKSTTELVLDLKGNPAAGRQQVWEITTPGAFTWTAPEDGEYEIVLCGAGASGARYGSDIGRALGGNSGNIISIYLPLTSASSVTGAIGAGGVGVSSDSSGNPGNSSSVLINGKTYTALGGRAGTLSGTDWRTNHQNDAAVGNILGAVGGTINGPSSYGGQTPLLGGTVVFATTTGISGTRGSGGSGSTGTSGKGGDGVLRITLVHGSGK